MASVEETPKQQTGEYLWSEYQGAKKANGIGQRAWVRQAYPNMTYDQWWGRVWRYKKSLDGYMPPSPNLFNNFIEEVQIYDGDWVIVSDVHAPCTDYDYSQLVGAIAEKHLPGCQGLIVAGDFLNCDAFSSYDSIAPLPSWRQECDAAEHLIKMWIEMFGRIIWLTGNHERRILRSHDGQIDMKMLRDMILRDNRVSIALRDRCFIRSDNGLWLIAHGKNYSQQQLANASKYAIKYQCNVICGHEHHLAIGQDLYKRYTVVSNGGLYDPHKLAYVQYETSTSPEMAKGFTVLKNGFAHVFGESHYTDWDLWLGEETK